MVPNTLGFIMLAFLALDNKDAHDPIEDIQRQKAFEQVSLSKRSFTTLKSYFTFRLPRLLYINLHA